MPESSVKIRRARLADAEEIARIHVTSWRTTYAGIVSDTTLADLSIEQRAADWRERLDALERGATPEHFICFVAVDASDKVIGFASGGRSRPLADGSLPIPYDGELYAIYLEPGATRRGAGRLLTYAVAQSLAATGPHALLIWALAANPSRGFYEALGGVVAFEQDITIGDQTLPEVAYGWPDISLHNTFSY